LLVGLGGSAVFYALFGIASLLHSLPLVFAARIGAGISGATIGTAQAVIADSTPPERRARGMALIGMAFGIGFTFGPLIGAFLSSNEKGAPLSGWPGFVAAGLSAAAFLLAATGLPETLPSGQAQRRSWFNLDGWRLALGNRRVAFPLLTFFVATLAFANFEGTVARFARDQLHYSMQQTGWLFAYVGFVLVLAQAFIVRRLVSKVGEVIMSIAGIALMLVGLLVVGILVSSSDLWAILIIMALAVTGFACLTPSAQALVSRRSSIFRQGEVLGVNQAAASIARILGPLMGNLLYGSQESPRTSLPFYAGAALLGAALILAMNMGGEDAGEREAETVD
jgi:MFS family permease